MGNSRDTEAVIATPLVLLVPDSPLDAGHWMQTWALRDDNMQIVELGMWDAPHRNTWVNKLNLAIHRSGRDVIVVTEGIAALALAWWHEFEQVEQAPAREAEAQPRVVGAMIVTPPDFDRPGSDVRVASFGACPRRSLPFATYVVTDFDSPHEVQRAALRVAADWDAWAVRETVRGGWISGQTLLQSLRGRIAAETDPLPVKREACVPDPMPRRTAPFSSPELRA